MAQKESSHLEVITQLETELTQVRRQYDELKVLSRNQVCIKNLLYELYSDELALHIDFERGNRDRRSAEEACGRSLRIGADQTA